MKKILLLLVTAPLLAFAAQGSGVQRFDKAHEGEYLGNRERINPTSSELRAISKEQGMPPPMVKRGFPLMPSTTQNAPENVAAPASPALYGSQVAPAPSYRTMGDAAKAGVDPLNRVVLPTTRAAAVEDVGKSDLYYYVSGILGFIVLGGIGFLFSVRTPKLREN